MTIYDLLYLACDNSFEIAVYDMTTETELYRGDASEIPSELEDLELMSFDAPTCHDMALVLNVETEED